MAREEEDTPRLGPRQNHATDVAEWQPSSRQELPAGQRMAQVLEERLGREGVGGTYHREVRRLELRGGLAPRRPKTPRMISRPTVRPIEEDSAPTSAPPATWAIVLPARPPLDASGTAGGSVFAIRAARISRALSLSTASPYSAIRSDCRMSAWSSSGPHRGSPMPRRRRASCCRSAAVRLRLMRWPAARRSPGST